ncbi:MAG: tetratricopeptide repeat protein [Chlorobiaceae bacterium]|nr:tetratricopeptide repeat protein [Chlorobiaceae bacterium]
MKTISSKAFLGHFCEDIREDKKFCFILGSGASRSSGIKTGAELVKQWIQELEERYSKEELESWYVQEEIAKDDPAAHYSKIFDKRYGLNKKDGYAFLEKLMENVEPSCGYSVLAQIMTQHPHNIVITPNFDSLSEDALFIYTQKKPLVVGHESLAHFIKPFTSRPLIIKIHHDVLLSPKNGKNEIDEMAAGYAQQLESIFRYYTPVVVGYGGNDGSLMGFLEKMDEIEGGLFWCYRESDGEPGKRICLLLEKLKGNAVPVKGFDELMIQIGDRLNLEPLHNKVLEIAQKRVESYQEQIHNIRNADHEDIDTANALSNMMERGEKDWWYYVLRAENEEDINKREIIYKEGLEQIKNSPQLLLTYAIYLTIDRKDVEGAEKYFEMAMEAAPRDSRVLGNYAHFLENERKDSEGAEKYYKKALEVDSKNVQNMTNYAFFLSHTKKDFAESEKFFKDALAINDRHANTLVKYAMFLTDIKKDVDSAEKFFKMALDVDTKRTTTLVNYAHFLENERKDANGAEKYYMQALEIDPNDAHTLSCYANFLHQAGSAPDEANKYYKKALEADPKDANTLGNYAKLFIEQGELKQAQIFLKKAFDHNSSYKYRADLDLELCFYSYAVFYSEYPDSQIKIEKLLRENVRSIGWNLKKVCEIAKTHGHPDYEKLCEYEKCITRK